MYEAHFGLSDRPFIESTSPVGFVPLPSRESVIRRLRYGLEHGGGPALLFGPPGTGKSLLARVLTHELASRPSVHLTFPAMPAADLLAFLADELASPSASSSPVPGPTPPLSASVRRLRSTLSAAALRGDRPLLVVDEAHLIDDPATFESLRLLLNFATSGPPDLALLLVGGPEVLLNLPASLADRLAARCLLGPLSEAESAAYVAGRLTASGADRSLFAADALRALHRAAEGLPRRLNRLADLCLLIAYAEGLDQPTTTTVAVAAREGLSDPLAA